MGREIGHVRCPVRVALPLRHPGVGGERQQLHHRRPVLVAERHETLVEEVLDYHQVERGPVADHEVPYGLLVHRVPGHHRAQPQRDHVQRHPIVNQSKPLNNNSKRRFIVSLYLFNCMYLSKSKMNNPQSSILLQDNILKHFSAPYSLLRTSTIYNYSDILILSFEVYYRTDLHLSHLSRSENENCMNCVNIYQNTNA
ncbi:hypothetical protein AGLY_013935 [Aphis glycines]|uniref:Uncharacterized protein n=1 Tax=Aphis glycines TaxID=307491 RepID=A0A6G0T500_APHGL|nr:hypothetical protein AGLY_013935 [Aphis glycines]